VSALARELLQLDRRALRERLRGGHAIDPRALDNTEYRGVSLGLPEAVVSLTWLTFRKTFARDARSGALRGWNVRMVQKGLDGDRAPMKDGDGNPKCFGHYVVQDAASYRAPLAPPGALLIDYGWNGMRDPLVALQPGDASALLGFTYVAVGPLRIETPSFFLLEREGPLSYTPPLPSLRV
jgi:hypothetical protein